MENKSIWEDTVSKKSFQNTKKIHETDILIIGAGIAGIMTAFYLKDTDKKILMIDKGTVGTGITAHTTGKLTYLQGSYQKIKNIYNLNTAIKYLKSQKEAIHEVNRIVKKYNINCHLRREDSYLFSVTEKGKKEIKKEESCLREMGVTPSFLYELPNKYPLSYGICVKDTYTFHPLEFLYAVTDICLEHGILLEENRCVESIEKTNSTYVVHTNKGNIVAKNVIVCSHYPFFLSPSFIPLKTHIERSYLTASPCTQKENFTAISTDKDKDTMRYYENYFLFGSMNHKTSTHTDTRANEQELLKKYKEMFSFSPTYIWTAHDILSDDYLPYIGFTDKEKTGLMIATAFHKWGMTNGTLAGKIIADLLIKGKNDYENLFAPYRSYNLSRCITLLGNALSTGKIFMQTKLIRNPSFYPDCVSVYKKDGIYYGTYKDSNGKKYTVYNKCPHLGCSLIFNLADKTWDCPCHGSRFNLDGDVLNGPSSYSIKVKR